MSPETESYERFLRRSPSPLTMKFYIDDNNDIVVNDTNNNNNNTNNYNNCRYPTFVSEKLRLQSFEQSCWPQELEQLPKILAIAGFFYTGYMDCVRCYCCGGGICGWQSTDDPFTIHANLYNNCTYAQLVKYLQL